MRAAAIILAALAVSSAYVAASAQMLLPIVGAQSATGSALTGLVWTDNGSFTLGATGRTVWTDIGALTTQ